MLNQEEEKKQETIELTQVLKTKRTKKKVFYYKKFLISLGTLAAASGITVGLVYMIDAAKRNNI